MVWPYVKDQLPDAPNTAALFCRRVPVILPSEDLRGESELPDSGKLA